MRKIILLQLLSILLLGYSCDTKEYKSIVKGKVHKWPSDTVYISTLPYYSPFSAVVDYKVISKDSTFSFEFKDKEKPFFVFITPEKSTVKMNTDALLFDNLTEEHYYGHCVKFYNHSSTTYLIVPNKELTIDLTFNCWYDQLSQKRADYFRKLGANIGADNRARDIGETKIIFVSPEMYDYEYYQKTLDLDQEIDDYVRPTDSIEFAVKEFKEIEKRMLSELDSVKETITSFLYNHLHSHIEFAVRKEFLKFLQTETNSSYLENLFSKELPDYITDMIEFDKKEIDYAVLISEEYNEYLELYLNFKISIQESKYIKYKKFDKDKYNFAEKKLPEISKYFYLANNLLQTENFDDCKELAISLIKKYPKGELNVKLSEKYQ